MYTGEDGLTSPKVLAPTLVNLIGDLCDQQKLSQLRFDKTTLLFWSEPDVESDVAKARRLVAIGGLQVPVTPGQPQPNHSADADFEAQTGTLLADYLKRAQGWKGEVADPPLTIKFADLPEGLRDNLKTMTLQLFLRPIQSDEGWFTDKPWMKATIQILPGMLRDHNHVYTKRVTVASTADGKPRSISYYLR